MLAPDAPYGDPEWMTAQHGEQQGMAAMRCCRVAGSRRGPRQTGSGAPLGLPLSLTSEIWVLFSVSRYFASDPCRDFGGHTQGVLRGNFVSNLSDTLICCCLRDAHMNSRGRSFNSCLWWASFARLWVSRPTRILFGLIGSPSSEPAVCGSMAGGPDGLARVDPASATDSSASAGSGPAIPASATDSSASAGSGPAIPASATDSSASAGSAPAVSASVTNG